MLSYISDTVYNFAFKLPSVSHVNDITLELVSSDGPVGMAFALNIPQIK